MEKILEWDAKLVENWVPYKSSQKPTHHKIAQKWNLRDQPNRSENSEDEFDEVDEVDDVEDEIQVERNDNPKMEKQSN